MTFSASGLAGSDGARGGNTAVYAGNPGCKEKGEVRHCQGTVLADWIAVDKDAKELMAGTNVFAFRIGRENRLRDGVHLNP